MQEFLVKVLMEHQESIVRQYLIYMKINLIFTEHMQNLKYLSEIKSYNYPFMILMVTKFLRL